MPTEKSLNYLVSVVGIKHTPVYSNKKTFHAFSREGFTCNKIILQRI